MEKSIQILAGESQYIHGLYSKPDEDSLENIDQLLVIMVHGFPGNNAVHGDIFKDLEHLISDKNYHTLRFDFRGCGESDGRAEDFTLDTAAKDLQNILDWAKDQNYQRFIFVSEGLGAAFTLMNMAENAVCNIMLWPMLDLPGIAQKIFHADSIEDEWKKAGYILDGHDRIGLPFIEALQKTDIIPYLKNLDRPVMIMHGARDEISPIDQLDMIRTHTNARRVEITSFHDGSHGLPELNHRKTMFYHIMQFIEKYS